jgi:hypothetical protein
MVAKKGVAGCLLFIVYNFCAGSVNAKIKKHNRPHLLQHMKTRASRKIRKIPASTLVWYPCRPGLRAECGVRCDQIVALDGFYTNQRSPDKLRRVKYYDDQRDKRRTFLTNQLF